MTPVNRKAGTGERTRGSYQGKRLGSLSPVGFRATDLSVRFRDACQGGGAYGKRQLRILFPVLPDFSLSAISLFVSS